MYSLITEIQHAVIKWQGRIYRVYLCGHLQILYYFWILKKNSRKSRMYQKLMYLSLVRKKRFLFLINLTVSKETWLGVIYIPVFFFNFGSLDTEHVLTTMMGQILIVDCCSPFFYFLKTICPYRIQFSVPINGNILLIYVLFIL